MSAPHRSRWFWPRWNLLLAADPHWGFVRNVYYRGEPWEITIGVAFYVGRRGVGVRWRTPHTPQGWASVGLVEGTQGGTE